MIRVKLTNDILKKITEIEKIKVHVDLVNIPIVIENRFRKNSKKKSSYYSTKIEGNPLSEKQVGNVIEATDTDDHKHFLRPEQEVRNYYLALKYLEEQLIPMGLIFILLLSIRNVAFIERIANNKRLKIIAYVVIAMYYLGVLIKCTKMMFL